MQNDRTFSLGPQISQPYNMPKASCCKFPQTDYIVGIRRPAMDIPLPPSCHSMSACQFAEATGFGRLEIPFLLATTLIPARAHHILVLCSKIWRLMHLLCCHAPQSIFCCAACKRSSSYAVAFHPRLMHLCRVHPPTAGLCVSVGRWCEQVARACRHMPRLAWCGLRQAVPGWPICGVRAAARAGCW